MSIRADEPHVQGHQSSSVSHSLSKSEPVARIPETARVLSGLDTEINILQGEVDKLVSRLQLYLRNVPREDGLDSEKVAEALHSEFAIALNTASTRVRSSRLTITDLLERMEI